MEQQKENQEPEKRPLNTYARYSALGFQMIAIIGAFTFAGYQLDKSQASAIPIYTAILSLVGIGISLYFIFKGLK
ncbi:MAG TPA: AtpZ/AtpI family protein [Pelobium sp.]